MSKTKDLMSKLNSSGLKLSFNMLAKKCFSGFKSFVHRLVETKSFGLRFFINGFAPGSWLCLALLALSVWIAVGIYEQRQIENQKSLRTSLTDADPIAHFCRTHPQFSRALCLTASETTVIPTQLSYAMLLEAEVITDDDYETPINLDGNAPREILLVRDKLDTILRRRFSEEGTGKKTAGLTMLSEFAGLRCLNDQPYLEPDKDRNPKTQSAASSTDIRRGAIAAHLLADIPGEEASLRTLGRTCESSLTEARMLMLGGANGSLPTPKGFRLSSRTCIGTPDVLLLLSEASAAVASPNMKSKTTNFAELGYLHETEGSKCLANMQGTTTEKSFEPEEFLKAQQNITVFSEFLLAQIFETTEVKNALTQLQMWRGPEHIGIITLSVFVLLVVFSRSIVLVSLTYHSKIRGTSIWRDIKSFSAGLSTGGTDSWVAQRELDEGRRYQRWALASIPGIGFIGTVRGILNALPEAREVVFASSTLGRADAIGSLAGELGLAFSTTLFALIASIVLSFVLLISGRAEAAFLRIIANQNEVTVDNVSDAV